MISSEGQVLEDCTPGPTSSCVDNLAAPLDKQGLNGSYVQFRVLCTNAGLACTRKLGVVATHLWTTLEDPLGPAVVNNRVIDDGQASGTLRVGFDAADVGGGLYRTLVKVDGRITQAIPLGPPPCNDVHPGDLDPYQFNVPVPRVDVVGQDQRQRAVDRRDGALDDRRTRSHGPAAAASSTAISTPCGPAGSERRRSSSRTARCDRGGSRAASGCG